MPQPPSAFQPLLPLNDGWADHCRFMACSDDNPYKPLAIENTI